MKPWQIVERAPGADRAELVLARRDDEWVVRAGGQLLMTSRSYGSEQALASLALERCREKRTVLLGGLGMGFSLRAALDRLGPEARVTVAELSEALVGWNRGPLAELAGRPLEDPRVELQVVDVARLLFAPRRRFDAILLDVDNGPKALSQAVNDRLYGEAGVYACWEALNPGGVLGVWSAGDDQAFRKRLELAGFTAKAKSVSARPDGGGRHVIFLGVKDGRSRAR